MKAISHLSILEKNYHVVKKFDCIFPSPSLLTFGCCVVVSLLSPSCVELESDLLSFSSPLECRCLDCCSRNWNNCNEKNTLHQTSLPTDFTWSMWQTSDIYMLSLSIWWNSADNITPEDKHYGAKQLVHRLVISHLSNIWYQPMRICIYKYFKKPYISKIVGNLLIYLLPKGQPYTGATVTCQYFVVRGNWTYGVVKPCGQSWDRFVFIMRSPIPRNVFLPKQARFSFLIVCCLWGSEHHCLMMSVYLVPSLWASIHQSCTKPNLVAKILATNFGVFFVIYVTFPKIC